MRIHNLADAIRLLTLAMCLASCDNQKPNTAPRNGHKTASIPSDGEIPRAVRGTEDGAPLFRDHVQHFWPPAVGSPGELQILFEEPKDSDGPEWFQKHTGLRWTPGSKLLALGNSKGGFLGDGELHVVFEAEPDTIKSWLAGPAPWGGEWHKGPVPAEIAFHCNFLFEGPKGYGRCAGTGMPEISGGSPRIRALLMSDKIRYCANQRTKNPPWYNGDLLILDVENNRVWYSMWDL